MDDRLATATTAFFERWEGTYAGRFLHRRLDGQLVADPLELIDHAPRLSGGEQVYAALWWELTRGPGLAPWLDRGALSQLGSLDADYRQSVVELITAVNAAWTHRRLTT